MSALVAGASCYSSLWHSTPGQLEVITDTYTYAYPELAFGRPITGMEPLSRPIAMEGT